MSGKAKLFGPMVIIALPLILTMVFNVLIAKLYEKYMENNENNSSNYYGNYLSRKEYRKEYIFSSFLKFMMLFLFFTMASMVAGIVLVENGNYFWNGMGIYIDKIGEKMFTMWMSLVGLFFVFATFSKRTWLVFDAYDVIKRYNIKDTLIQMGIFVLTDASICFLKPIILNQLPYAIYFVIRLVSLLLFIMFIYDFIRLSVLLIDAYFGGKINMRFLDSLYSELRYYPLKCVTKDKWDEMTAWMQIQYLNDELKKISKRVDVKKFDFESNLSSNENETERSKSLRKRSCVWYIVCVGGYFVIISGAIVIALAKRNDVEVKELIIAIVTFAVMLVVFVAQTLIENRKMAFKIFLTELFYGTCNYDIVTKKGKRKYISEYVFIHKLKSQKYIHAVKNIIAFYLITPQKDRNSIIDALKRDKTDQTAIGVLYYLAFIENKDRQHLFKDIKLDNPELLNAKIKAFCMDISIRTKGMTKAEFEKEFGQFRRVCLRKSAQYRRYNKPKISTK